MNELYRNIYRLVAQIPEGRVATYGQIAALAGNPRAARTVGWAMHSVPRELRLPCHRVVNRAGQLAPLHIFGPGMQRALLEAEGVTFNRQGCINMRAHLWRGPKDQAGY